MFMQQLLFLLLGIEYLPLFFSSPLARPFSAHLPPPPLYLRYAFIDLLQLNDILENQTFQLKRHILRYKL